MSASTQMTVTLALSQRDAEWLAAITAVVGSMLNPACTDEQAESNVIALERLFYARYSGAEGNALMLRIREHLPADTPLVFLNPALMQSSASFVQ